MPGAKEVSGLAGTEFCVGEVQRNVGRYRGLSAIRWAGSAGEIVRTV